MADVFVYADETGNLDYEIDGKVGATPYFGFGTAMFRGAHGNALWEGLQLRAKLEHGDGINPQSMPRGFHALHDSNRTRAQMFSVVKGQRPQVHATLLLKSNARSHVKAAGGMRLYKMAWYLHFKYLAEYVIAPGDTAYVVVATFGTKARQKQATAALRDVCSQTRLQYVLCTWDSATSWGLQVADYCLWSIQRRAELKSGTWWDDYVSTNTCSVFFPWGSLHPELGWGR